MVEELLLKDTQDFKRSRHPATVGNRLREVPAHQSLPKLRKGLSEQVCPISYNLGSFTSVFFTADLNTVNEFVAAAKAGVIFQPLVYFQALCVV